MKISQKNKSNPIGSTSSSENNSTLKILLFTTDHPSVRLLMRAITQEGHVIVETVYNPESLPPVIAASTPHLVVAHFADENPERELIHRAIRILFPDLPILTMTGDLACTELDWRTKLEAALNSPIQPEKPRPYAEGARVIYYDESLAPFCTGKSNHLNADGEGEKFCSDQEARFLLQLQTGRKNHAAAQHYFACLRAQQNGLDQKIGDSLVHGSFKSISWSRDLCCKWLALLAHYVPDVELQYLPRAGTAGPGLDYVHHSTPIEGVYASTLILLSGIKSTIAEAIKQVVAARFDGQGNDDLLGLSLRLYGMSKMLEQVGAAQIELMDSWLDPSIDARASDGAMPRSKNRYFGIYRDFYDLTLVVNSPEPLASILKGFHAGTTDVPQERFLPSFAEFRRLCKSEGLSTKR